MLGFFLLTHNILHPEERAPAMGWVGGKVPSNSYFCAIIPSPCSAAHYFVTAHYYCNRFASEENESCLEY